MRQIVAALDLGTSKSIAFVAQKDFSGKLSVLRTETLLSKNAIRRGRVYNSDETGEIVSKLIRKLNNDPALQIEKIYVGIGGQSLHTQSFSVKKPVENGTVSRQLLDSIEEEANRYQPEFDKNLGLVSCEYYADGQLVSNPKGTVASTLEARFQLIVGNPCLKLNLEKVFKGKDISVAEYVISPLATAEAVLTPEEKDSGCALVELGDGVTYVSIYKNKALKYLVTLPLGGLSITKDIRSLNVSEEEAEALKIKYGNLFHDSNDSGEVPVSEGLNLSRKIELRELNWIIEARTNEIVKNIWSQIQASGYSQALDAGIVITGGGALLRNLPQYIRNQIEKEVRLAYTKVWINQVETQLSPTDSCVVGIAMWGKENCTKEEKGKIQSSFLFGAEEAKETVKKQEKNKEKKNVVSPVSHEGISFKDKLKGIFDKGVKIVDKGATLFTDEDFDNNTSQPINKRAGTVQSNDNNSVNDKK